MSVFGDVERAVVVAARREVADGVVALDLAPANGRPLPPWTPGAHVDLLLGGGVERQYSLCGDPADRELYRVAVLREEGGRGGSARVHDEVAVGAALRVRGPRNHFPFDVGAAHSAGAPVLLVAGGIGITPLLPMAAAAEAAGVPWELHHAGRSRRTMAFAAGLAAAHPDRVRLYPADEGARLDVAALVAASGESGQLYCCGPRRLVDAAEAGAAASPGWTAHVERFEAREVGPPVWPEPFEVELELTGTTVTVEPGTSVLTAVEEAGAVVVSSCRTGTCGSCETVVLEGDVEHRDSVLGPGADTGTMMICVSRAAGPRLVLDL